LKATEEVGTMPCARAVVTPVFVGVLAVAERRVRPSRIPDFTPSNSVADTRSLGREGQPGALRSLP
jgi:hypothetical protein